LQDCLLYRRPHTDGYRVLHRPWVGSDCVLRESLYDPGSSLTPPGETHRTVAIAVIGTKTANKEGCRDEYGRIHNIGARYYREHGQFHVCGAPRTEEQRGHCFVKLAELPEQMKAQWTELGRVSGAISHGLSSKVAQIDALPGHLVDKAQEVHDGTVTLRTHSENAARSESGRRAYNLCSRPKNK